ncbi:MAG TPA: ATP-binding protein, partial [Steroidobacter sp.]|nr:ATP-binding protein [Steroidobacter sp.]
ALGRDIHELLATAFPEALPEVQRKLRRDGSWRGEVRQLSRCGDALTVESRQTLAGRADDALVMEVNRDITPRKAFERALQKSEETLRLATDAANIGVWTWDIATDALQWNSQGRAILGQQQAPSSRAAFRELIHPDDREEARAAVDAALQTRSVFQTQYRVVRPDGSVRWLSTVGRADYGDDGRPARMVGLLTDITEQRVIEQALRDADRRKNEFLAMLGHELRNPLAPIRNAALILRKQAPSDSMIRQASDVIDRQVRHVARLVDDLLDVSRITLGRITIRTERLSLGAVVASAVEASRPMIEKSGHVLTVALAGEPIELDADPTRLSQVICNLLNNAVKYTPPGGSISLSTARVGDEAVISVSDTGIGIAPEMLSYVFGMFTQVESANDRAQGGLGIGLALGRALVELHGGRIEARSAGLGHGSEFIVTLPLPSAARRNASSGAPLEAERGGVRGRRVLVVDDNVDAAESLALHLRLRWARGRGRREHVQASGCGARHRIAGNQRL